MPPFRESVADTLSEVQELWRIARPRRTNLRLLVVDEEREVGHALQRYFADWGLETYRVNSARQALKFLHTRQPQMMLLEVSPYSALAWRSLLPWVPRVSPRTTVLGVTTRLSVDWALRLEALGVHCIFQKPCGLSTLAQGVFEVATALALTTPEEPIPVRTA